MGKLFELGTTVCLPWFLRLIQDETEELSDFVGDDWFCCAMLILMSMFWLLDGRGLMESV